MGTCPEEYKLFQAAKYCNVAPWVLAEQSIWWRHKALIYELAEQQAQKIIAEHNT